ncbi:MAG: UDP-N-acetylmuramate dehydrogenase [Limisphaerales bacterium]
MPDTQTIFEVLKARLPQCVVRENESLSKRTTLRVGGTADVYVEPASEEDVARILQFCGAGKIPVLVLGRGSNLLIRDGGIRGVVICLAHANFARIEADGSRLRCGAGVKLKAVAAKARDLGLGGLEFLEGIPGSVGGALRMNAGAMGSSTFAVITHVRFMDENGKVEERAAGEIPAEYRSCPFFKTRIALAATFAGQPDSKAAISQRAEGFNQIRWKSQPKESSAGCIFKNPSLALSAGQLIDQLGLKGARRGGAVVSDVHANFIVNDGTASAADVLELIDFVKAQAKARRGIDLHEEVEIIGQ